MVALVPIATLKDVTVKRRGKTILGPISHDLESAGFTIVLGPNGAGKTSLFKMITGELDVEEGYLDYPQDLRISYLAQEVPGTDEVAVQYVLEGDKQLIEIQEKIKLAEANEQFDEWVIPSKMIGSLD